MRNFGRSLNFQNPGIQSGKTVMQPKRSGKQAPGSRLLQRLTSPSLRNVVWSCKAPAERELSLCQPTRLALTGLL